VLSALQVTVSPHSRPARQMSNRKGLAMTIKTRRPHQRHSGKLGNRARFACLLIMLALVGACGSSRHQAYSQSGDYDSGLKARAAEFVAALDAKDTPKMQDLVFPNQKKNVPAFLAAYGGRHAVLTGFPDKLDGPDTEGVANVQITCSASQQIVVPQIFSWKNGNWRTFIYLPGQKPGVTDQQCAR
jgi:hypothetical protein